MNDLKFAFRQLRKHPGFTAAAVLTLALGIGANTAIFSVIHGVLLKPLPYEDPGKLVQVFEEPSKGSRTAVSGGAFQDWKEHGKLLEEISVISGADMNLTGGQQPERVSGLQVSASFPRLLRARPLYGREFLPAEDQLGHDNKVVILTHRFWKRRFASDTNLVGQTIRFNQENYTVVGVLPPKALPAGDIGFIVPFVFGTADWQSSRGDQRFSVIARLKPGVTMEQAQSELASIKQRLQSEYPKWKESWSVLVRPMQEQIIANVRPTLLVLLGAVAFVLLIACANVANLLLAKSASRTKEMAIRAALGASPGRVMRQMLSESVLLALIGGGLGLAVAYLGLHLLTSFAGQALPRAYEVRLDLAVLGFSVLISLGTGLLFGVLPAWRIRAPNLNIELKEGGRGSKSASRQRVQSALIVGEVALSLVLLVGAGLLLKSFFHLSNVPPGFDTQKVLGMDWSLPERKYPSSEHRARFFHQVFERLEALPGVEAAGMATTLPMIGWGYGSPVKVEGRANQPEFGYSSSYDFVAGNYFRALGIPLLKGRSFSERDNSTNAPRMAILNEALARKIFPNEEPVGKQIRFWDQLWEVVGIAGNVRHDGLDGQSSERVYLPQAFCPWSGSLVVRTKIPPLNLADQIRKEILAVDPDQPVSNVRTLEQAVARSLATRRLALTLLGVFAGIALLLAGIGLYGVMAYSVAQRTQEIGIRMALGAMRRDVLGMVLRRGMSLTLLGVLMGLIGSMLLTRYMTAQLYEISPTDPLTLTSVALFLMGVALVACLIPARRATKIDPMEALRYE
jgi:putative ABC transport system permease protein